MFERAVEKLIPKGLGKAVLLPVSSETTGHGSYILAKLWKDELSRLLARSERRGP